MRTDVQNYGALTGRTSEATEVLAESNTQLAELQQIPAPTKKPRILLFDSGANELCTSGHNGPPQGVINAAGGVNVFGNQGTTWLRASWKSVAETQPNVIVVLDYRKDDADEIKNKLETIHTQPALANLDVVKQNHIIVLPLTLFISGYPNLETAVQIRKGLEQIGMTPESPVRDKLPEGPGHGVLKN